MKLHFCCLASTPRWNGYFQSLKNRLDFSTAQIDSGACSVAGEISNYFSASHLKIASNLPSPMATFFCICTVNREWLVQNLNDFSEILLVPLVEATLVDGVFRVDILIIKDKLLSASSFLDFVHYFGVMLSDALDELFQLPVVGFSRV